MGGILQKKPNDIQAGERPRLTSALFAGIFCRAMIFFASPNTFEEIDQCQNGPSS
jgi:hypothetical protein